MFIVGLVTSGVIIEAGLRRRIRRSFALAMTAEAVFLLLFMALGSELLPVSGDDDGELPLYLLIALGAVAMGLQNTSLRMAGESHRLHHPRLRHDHQVQRIHGGLAVRAARPRERF